MSKVLLLLFCLSIYTWPAYECTVSKVVGYYNNWARYRPGIGKFEPSNIDTSLVTHIIYSFARLNESTLKLKIPDDDVDDLANLVQLKSRGVKVLIAIGGWTDCNDPYTGKYDRLLANQSARSAFIADSLNFLRRYNLDGLDLDIRYPKNKNDFSQFCYEASVAFESQGKLLTASVSAEKGLIDGSYEIPSLAKSLDWINLMTYDIHGSWENKTGHVAPFISQPGDGYRSNVKFAPNYWRQQGMPAHKIIVGIPAYGQSFTLQNPNRNGIDAPASGPGTAGEFTSVAGNLAYYEIMQKIHSGQMFVVNNEYGSYAVGGNQWVSFDSVDDVKRKMEFIKSEGLGGAMLLSLDSDDFKNGYPLLSAIHNSSQCSKNMFLFSVLYVTFVFLFLF